MEKSLLLRALFFCKEKAPGYIPELMCYLLQITMALLLG